jgi:hypothetical protein
VTLCDTQEKRLRISQTVVLALHVDELEAPVHDDNVVPLKSPHLANPD